MQDLVNTYTVKSKQSAVLWQFKYDLKGNLKAFEILEGQLTQRQKQWLFMAGNFPITEEVMQKVWLKDLKANFEIVQDAANLDFDTFWESYNHKVKKTMSQKGWAKLSKRDRIDALAHIPVYDKYLARKHVAKAAPSTYINQRYWEDNHGSIH